MLQIGDVDFDTAAGDDYNFVFTGVADPAEVVEQVDRATHAARPPGSATSPPPPSAQEPAWLSGDVGGSPASRPAAVARARRRGRSAPR